MEVVTHLLEQYGDNFSFLCHSARYIIPASSLLNPLIVPSLTLLYRSSQIDCRN